MKKRTVKQMLAVMISATMVLSLTACGGKTEEKKEVEPLDVTIDQIKLGEDYTDIKADLKFLTHKTDVVDTTFKGYVEEFQKLYPNVNIEYEGMDNFERSNGYSQRFALVYVDYRTQERILKDSAYWYRDVIRSNGAEL